VASHATYNKSCSNFTALLEGGFEQPSDTGKINFNTLFSTSTSFMTAKLPQTKAKNGVFLLEREGNIHPHFVEYEYFLHDLNIE
jgi:hypothetical protein